MKPLCTLAAAVAALALAAPVYGSTTRTLSDRHVGTSRRDLVAQRDYSATVIRSLAGSWKVAPRHATCWSHVPWARVCDQARRRLLAHRWLYRLAVKRLTTFYPPPIPAYLLSAFDCIHGYEGAWNANTGNGYYGGLQMDARFQSAYGREFVLRYGTADRWPIRDQLLAAVRAYKSGRGFYPWPTTAHACGLI